MHSLRTLVSLLALSLLCTQAFSQSRTEKKEAKIEESTKPKSIAGGVEVRIQQPYADTYEALVNWTKRSGYTIDRADKDVGQIITAMTVTGGVSQTGTRIFLSALKENDTETTVKVAVSEQNRKKLLQTEPWGEPKLNDKESQALAERVKTALQLKPSSQVAATPTAASSPAQTRKPITNSDVIRLVKNGFVDEQVLAVIAASEPKFDTSVDALIELKSAGVSQKLMETILLAGRPPAASPAARPSVGPDLSLATAATGSAPPAQPYVQIIGNSDKSILPPHSPTMLQTNAKGDSMTTIMADSAVRGVASGAITSAATSAILAGPGIAAIPVVGFAGTAISKLPGLRRDPTVTLVYALENRQSANVISSAQPKFEMYFGDVVGANPADFAPAIVKISPTENNWRMTGAQKTNPKNLQSHDRTEFKFIEDVIPSRTTDLGRGHVGIEPQNPLPPGEYGIVLRPTSKTWKVDMSNLVAKIGEGVLVMPVWDFTVGAGTDSALEGK